MFGALLANLTWIQVFQADRLANHPANTRLLLKEYSIERGPIRSADDQTLAISRPTPGEELKFLRTYDQGELFAHAVGYYSVRFGRGGLEQFHNKELTGKSGVLTMQDLGDQLLGEGEKGDALVLSIDSNVQRAAKQALGARKGAVVALDPLNGQMLAMYANPSFDPNPLSAHSGKLQEQTWKKLTDDKEKPLLNRATAATYPPGSTFKLITAAAALESGKQDVTYPAAKEYQAPRTTRQIRNFGSGTCGGDLAQALKVSCNTYFAKLAAEELPDGALEETAKAFGFTERPPLKNSAAVSRLPTVEELEEPAFRALSALGQFEVAATPLQMALVAAGIANGGKVPAPKMVKQVEDARGGLVEQAESEIWKEAVSSGTASALTRMMIEVVRSGTGRAAAVPGTDVAGKTGTAQTGEETPGLAWFVGFAPASSPRIALAVVVEGAGDGRTETGGRLAAPMARTVFEAHRTAARW